MLVLLALLAVALALQPLGDFDVWYHLAAARLLWTSGAWPTSNAFAFSVSDRPDVDVYWLYQLGLYGAHSVAGPNGCILLAAALTLATVGTVYVAARRHAPGALVASLLALALVAASPRLVPRPELVGSFLLAVFLLVLDDYPRSGRALYALLPLQVLWTNTHGTVPIGMLVVACYWLGAACAFLPLPAGWRAASGCTRAELGRLTLVLVLLPVVTLLNPWGLAGARLPLDMLAGLLGDSAAGQSIGELQPPSAVAGPVAAPAWSAMVVVAALSFLFAVRRWHLGRVLAVAIFALVSARAFKAVPPFVWVAVPAIAANLGPLVRGWEGRSRVASAVAGLALATLLGLVLTNRYWRAASADTELRLGVSRLRTPAEAVDFALEVGLGSRPFNTFESGGYLAWRLYPERRVFIDGRTSAYPESLWDRYFTALEEPETWPRLAAEHGFDWALVYHRYQAAHPLAAYLAGGHGWTMVYRDEIASLYVPTDEAHRELAERARRAFAQRPAAAPPAAPAHGAWRRLVVPVEEPQRHSASGEFLRGLGAYREAIEAYERALALDPDLPWTRYGLGVAAWLGGDPGRAVGEWRETLRRDPGFEPAREALDMAAAQGIGAPRLR